MLVPRGLPVWQQADDQLASAAAGGWFLLVEKFRDVGEMQKSIQWSPRLNHILVVYLYSSLMFIFYMYIDCFLYICIACRSCFTLWCFDYTSLLRFLFKDLTPFGILGMPATPLNHICVAVAFPFWIPSAPKRSRRKVEHRSSCF